MNKPKGKDSDALLRKVTTLSPEEIDTLYGLEPVYEPGQGGIRGLVPEEFVSIRCPWCGERLETHVDLSAGERTYVEDCQVCCRPMELSIELENNGALRAVRVQRVE